MKRIFTFFLTLVIGISPVYALKKKERFPSRQKFEAINIGWWDNFKDPCLKEYVLKAVIDNHDARIAGLKTQQYQQFVNQIRAGEMPKLFIAPTYTRIKTPKFDLNGLNFDSSGTNLFALPLFASYEADIFMKNHDKTRAARKQHEASVHEEKAVYISLVTSVATTYFNIVKLDKLIEIQEEIVDLRREIHDLTLERYKDGLATMFDTTQTDKLYTIARIDLNDLQKNRLVMLHQLAVLTGVCPGNSDKLPRSKFDDIEYHGEIPETIESDVVINRPDLMKAEADLEKALIDIRIARKEFLPSIPIIGAVGFTALDLGKLFNWDSTFALLGVSLMQSIFTGGKKIANLKTKKIVYKQLLETYQQADLIAIQEINDSLVQVKYDTKKDEENLRKLILEKNNYALVNERYNEGITSYLDKIQYRENLLAIEKEKSLSKIQRLIDYLSLYKAVGARL